MNRPPAPDGGEFGFIARHFAPLARGEPGAFDLTDDAAVLTPEPGRQTVVTTDVLVSGVHFLPDTPPADVAHKALSVNLSDLAAMGARADAYTLGVAVPRGADSPDDAWWDAFCGRLAALQAHTGVVLVGGDTVSTPGPLSLSVTALGSVPAGRALRRAGAAAGDLVCLSGTVGDAALGLAMLQDGIPGLPADDRTVLVGRHRRPTARLDLGRALRDLATAAADVSDGLLADLGHICEASGLGARVRPHALPLSDAARRALEVAPDLADAPLAGGDDYELVFTLPPHRRDDLAGLSARLDLRLTVIGTMTESRGLRLVDPKGHVTRPDRVGFRHF